MSIPRRIIQTHESLYTFSDSLVSCRNTARHLNADYDYQFFSASERRTFIKEFRPALLELYDFFPLKIQKADLFRIAAVDVLGGFYLDLDVLVYKRLDSLCSAKIVLTEEWEMTEDVYRSRHDKGVQDGRDLIQIGNYAFGGCKGHWFFSEWINEILRRAECFDPSTIRAEDVYFTTGPDVLSAVFASHRDRLVDEAVVLGGGKNDRWCQFGEYGCHLMTGSWT